MPSLAKGIASYVRTYHVRRVVVAQRMRQCEAKLILNISIDHLRYLATKFEATYRDKIRIEPDWSVLELDDGNVECTTGKVAKRTDGKELTNVTLEDKVVPTGLTGNN